jgi:hypothetical protein
MSLSVTRYIEVFREQYQDFVYKNDMKHIGTWKNNDIVMVYTGDVHFYKIAFPHLSISKEYSSDSDKVIETINYGEIEYIPITDVTYDEEDKRIVYHCECFEKLPEYQLPLYDNVIYKTVNGRDIEFYKYYKGNWLLINECPKQWELVKYLSEKNEQTFSIITGCNIFVRNNICYTGYDESKLANRGLPDNTNILVKLDISEYDFGLTNVLLSELKDERNKLIDNIKHTVTDYCSKFAINDISDKVLLLLKHFNIEYNKDNSDDVAFFDEDFEDALYMLLGANDEIQLISGFVNKYFKNNYIEENKVRITYAFEN